MCSLSRSTEQSTGTTGTKPVVTAPASTIATPTASKVMVNGKSISFEAYNIGGNNYFKLRDLAAAVNGSDKQFSVGWDGSKNAISLGSGQIYTSVGGELAASANSSKKDAAPHED